MIWILTCEHFSNVVPSKYAPLFENAGAVLNSHRGYDKNIAPLFEALKPLVDFSFHYPYSRLIIEPNRSLHHRHLFSPFTLQLSKADRMELVSKYYQPYRNEVVKYIEGFHDDTVIHISVHSFTPNFGTQNRSAPIGILFDSKCHREKEVAKVWKKELQSESSVQVRFNYPYRGAADGFTTYLRKQFPENYLGFELELRNDCVEELSTIIIKSIKELRAILDE